MNSSTFPLPIKDGILRIDGSAFSDLMTCGIYYGFKHGCKRVPTGEKDALVFGGAGHAGLAAWHKGGRLDDAIKASQEHFDKHPCELGYRTPERMAKVLGRYVEEYPREKETARVLGVEESFEHGLGLVELPLPNSDETGDDIRVYWQGRRDLRYQLPAGEIVIRDTKFTSSDMSGYADSFLLSIAMRGYVWADRQEGIPTVGCELERIIVRDELKRANSYGNKPREEFTRFPIVYYSDQQLADWRRTVLTWVQTYLDWHSEGWVPGNHSQCSRFGRPCEYLSICTLPGEQRATMLATDMYKDYTWNPLSTEQSL